jgi:anthranilate synthase
MTEVGSYETRGGIAVECSIEPVAGQQALDALTAQLDAHRGVLLASSYEYPGRYTRWDMGFVDPALVLVARGRSVAIEALNPRGRVLLAPIARMLTDLAAIASFEQSEARLRCTVREPEGRFPEEERSRQPSVFSVLRALVELFGSDADAHLGFYGAFGYDLALQFEPLRLRLERPAQQRDLVLYLPDELLLVDHRREVATRRRYEFRSDGAATHGIPRTGVATPYLGRVEVERPGDHAPGEYAGVVRGAKESFRRGDLFEVVPGQIFFESALDSPATVFGRLRVRNPAPYGFLMNLGEGEYLIGASPEMYVRVEGRRVETCPISGTIRRGSNAIEDAEQIKSLLNSEKDESELTMCTDVDRNDKSRICEPGSVRVIGRRQIELYSRLIHTVDHVEGTLRPGFDALDAFLCHAWAVTVTGAPKAWAMQFIEDHERSSRAWYGGAVGLVGFDGNLNTGLTLRTIRVQDGVAQIRVGATLLYDSDPEAEEEETHVKASALVDAIRRPDGVVLEEPRESFAKVGLGKRVLLVDHQDSFVHTLANYLRQTGAEVTTWRSGFPHTDLDALAPDLVVLSPGPGSPSDFDVAGSFAALRARGLPAFGVCLGLQGMVEHFGGKLGVLDYPMHGKSSWIDVRGGALFDGLPKRFRAGRYHSLYALRDSLPGELRVTAESEDGIVMALEHVTERLAAVQFHPESILTPGELGLRLIANAVAKLCGSA